MRTETDPTDDQKPWKPFGEKVVKPVPQKDEWQKSPDAPGVEYNWKTGKTRTNMPLPKWDGGNIHMQYRDILGTR